MFKKKKPGRKSLKVVLSTGIPIELSNEDGLEHLFNAIFNEIPFRVKLAPGLDWSDIYENCLDEIQYISEQLKETSFTFDLLSDEFYTYWKMLTDSLRKECEERGYKIT